MALGHGSAWLDGFKWDGTILAEPTTNTWLGQHMWLLLFAEFFFPENEKPACELLFSVLRDFDRSDFVKLLYVLSNDLHSNHVLKSI